MKFFYTSRALTRCLYADQTEYCCNSPCASLILSPLSHFFSSLPFNSDQFFSSEIDVLESHDETKMSRIEHPRHSST